MSELQHLKRGWRVVPFKDIADSITERVDDPSAAGVDRYVGLEHLDSETTVIRRWGSPDDVGSTKLRFYPGDVVYGRRRAYQRKLGVADFEGICSAHALVLRARPDHCLPEFLPYFLQSDDFHERAVGISVGSLSPTINWTTLAKEKFALPPLDEQERLVEVMAQFEGVGRYLKASRNQTRHLRQAVIDEVIWNSGSSTWNVPLVRVEELLLEPPKNGTSPPECLPTEGVMTVSISAIEDGRFQLTEGVQKWCVPDKDVSRFAVRSGDAFVVRGNGNRSLVGRVGLCVNQPSETCIYPDLLIRLRFDSTKINPLVAAELWNHRRIHARLLARAKSSNGIYKVNGSDIRSHLLPVPSLEDQERLSSQLTGVRELEGGLEKGIRRTIEASVAMRESFLGGANR